jgi:cation diffusion facilitator CzcD-associated flavoprotein CzcO
MDASAGQVDSVDVLIVGAGISGIGAAYYLQRDHPGRRYAVLEARGASGGTWDLFRFPGVRSDSDLHTFGYEFRRRATTATTTASPRTSRGASGSAGRSCTRSGGLRILTTKASAS